MTAPSTSSGRRTLLAATALCLAHAPAAPAATLLPDALIEAVRAGAIPALPPLPATLPGPEALPTLQRLPGETGDDGALGRLPNPRALSNALASMTPRIDDRPLSMLAVGMLQLGTSHEIARSPSGFTTAPIPVNDTDTPGEAVFSSDIAFSRSLARIEDGAPQQLNDVTVAFDGSTVYGSDLARMAQIREAGTPFLKVDPATGGLHRVPVPLPGGGTALRAVAGDVRADENPLLEALHVLFVKEHNRLAGEIAARCPDCTDDQVFDAARYLVAKTQENILYDELLPVLLDTDPGDLGSVLTGNGIDPALVGQVDRALNSFTAGAGRLGHTQVADTILLATPDGPAREVPLADCFFDRACLGGASFDEILYGARVQRAEAVDVVVTDALRNALLPGFGLGPDRAADLFALNIQRGRDHGLPHYFALREILGLGSAPADAAEALALLPAEVFAAYGTDPMAVADFSLVEIDPLVGLFAEDRPSSRILGETGRVLWALQFLGLSQDHERSAADGLLAAMGAQEIGDGDPFGDYLAGVTMAGLLAAHTGIGAGVWGEAFRAPEVAPIPAPASLLLALSGLAALATAKHRRAARGA
jgi:peroxidase